MMQRAQFQRLDRNFQPLAGKEITVQCNPTEFTLSKGVQIADINIPGLDMPVLQFVRGQTETLSLDLFFDSTESGMGDDATSVTEQTDKFYQLVKIDRETHAPPVCRFYWGPASFPGSNFTDQWASQNRANGFQCIVESVRQRFTLFSPQGVPLRATLSVSLREYKTIEQQINQINFQSPDHTHTHVVQEGDTLSRISNKAYDDPRHWRQIAEHNGIVDPLDLKPGMVLEIPPLR
jgi:Contractile injection system tube protein/LysM domain